MRPRASVRECGRERPYVNAAETVRMNEPETVFLEVRPRTSVRECARVRLDVNA
jgi:hypothetical protein